MSLARPEVWLKAGVTLDGRIADAFGRSQWITGPQAREAGHHLRGAVDAVMVGSGTLLADDPSLNTRVPGLDNALPVVLDSRLRCPDHARVLFAGRRALIFCADDAPERALPADIERVPRTSGGGLHLPTVLSRLHARGVRKLLVEGGGQLHRALLDLDLADALHLFVAPLALAGGPGWLAGPGIPLADAQRWRFDSAEMVGQDVHLVLRRTVVTEGGTRSTEVW